MSPYCFRYHFSSNSTPSSAASINLRNTFVDTSVILWRLKSSTPIRSARVINDKEGKYFILFFPAYIRRIRRYAARRSTPFGTPSDRKSVVEGKVVSVSVNLGGRR